MLFQMRRFLTIILLMVLADIGYAAQLNDYSLGVYYFPGWKYGVEGNPKYNVDPWAPIKAFPEREPLLGWYPEGDQAVMDQQLKWMSDYGINFVVFDWYWSRKDYPLLEHALNAYLKSPERSKVKFTILWANHNEIPTSLGQFKAIVNHWIKSYFNKPEFVQVDGKPVVYIYDNTVLATDAARFGKTPVELIDIAQQMAKDAGYKGIFFVANSAGNWTSLGPKAQGYDALSTYFYSRGFNGKVGPYPGDSDQLLTGYMQNWEWITGHINLPYFVPVTMGWDKRPWGKLSAWDDCCSGTPEKFEKMLISAKKVVDTAPEKTKRTVVICCWNEYGEGNYIEPTKKYRFQFLEKIKNVFGAAR